MVRYSFILPCQNEEKTVGKVIDGIHEVMAGKEYEIILSDSSTDHSRMIAEQKGAKVIHHGKKGYGTAIREGVAVSTGEILVIGDADDTYDFREIPLLLSQIEAAGLVIGSRYKGVIQKGAMPLHHRYIGNPLISRMIRFFFRCSVTDALSGLRVIKKSTLESLGLTTNGMEYASEMVIKACKKKMRIIEVPITYHKRVGRSKTRSLGDGWKHLRFIMLYSPLFLFFVPGIFLFSLGSFLLLLLRRGPVDLIWVHLDIHPLILGALLTILGFQIIILGIFAKTFAVTQLGEKDRFISFLHSHLSLERGLLIGLFITLLGILINVRIFVIWAAGGFGSLYQTRNAVVAMTIIVIGITALFSTFFLSLLGIKR